MNKYSENISNYIYILLLGILIVFMLTNPINAKLTHEDDPQQELNSKYFFTLASTGFIVFVLGFFLTFLVIRLFPAKYHELKIYGLVLVILTSIIVVNLIIVVIST